MVTALCCLNINKKLFRPRERGWTNVRSDALNEPQIGFSVKDNHSRFHANCHRFSMMKICTKSWFSCLVVIIFLLARYIAAPELHALVKQGH